VHPQLEHDAEQGRNSGPPVVVACADIGSIKKNNFGWAIILCGEQRRSGQSIHGLVDEVTASLSAGNKVALGFECPLWVPVPEDPEELTTGRAVDGNKPWSAGAGASALAAGLTETAWILREIRWRLTDRGISPPLAFLDWSQFAKVNTGLFLWEAFVTGAAKAPNLGANTADMHVADAMIACKEFVAHLSNPASKSYSESPHPIRSLIGAAMLWSGWSKDLSLLRDECLVVKP